MSYNLSLQSNNAELQALIDIANALPEAGGVELPTLTTPAQASEVFLNKETIDEDGNVQVGTFTIDSELTTQNNLIAQIQSAVDNLPEAGGNGGGGSSETGICPSLTITSNGVDTDNIYIPQLDGTYLVDHATNRTGVTLYNIPINKPIIINWYSSFEPAINSYTNLKILCEDVHWSGLLIVECNSTSPATLDLYDND